MHPAPTCARAAAPATTVTDAERDPPPGDARTYVAFGSSGNHPDLPVPGSGSAVGDGAGTCCGLVDGHGLCLGGTCYWVVFLCCW